MAVDLANSIDLSDALTLAIVPRIAASGAALIMSSVDKINVFEHAKILFHRSYMVGKDGKAHRVEGLTRAGASADMLVNRYGKRLMTPKQYKAYLNNEDVWLEGKDLVINVRNNTLNAK